MRLCSIYLAVIVLFLTGCERVEERPHGPNEVRVIASEYGFVAPDTIPSGWTRFTMTNRGQEEHFLLVNPIPDGVTFSDMVDGAHFLQGLYESRAAGEIDKAGIYSGIEEVFGPPPQMIPYRGGPGLISSGKQVSATTLLKPGRYVIECYVRTPAGKQHNTLGMIRELVVSSDTTEASPPTHDREITLSSGEIQADSVLRAGSYTFEVEFNEHPSGYIGKDVHLFKVNDEADLEHAARWVDVFEPGGMEAPAPVEFVGGTQELPEGKKAYFSVELEPGQYAWISELDYGLRNWKQLTVN